MNTKEKIKNIPVIGQKLVEGYSQYLRLGERKFFRKNRELKNRYAGKRIFVIATGPSIKEQDLKPLAGEVCISVSNFFIHPDFAIIKPAFHLFVPSHPPVTAEQYGLWFKEAETRFPEGQNIFVGITDKHIVEHGNLFSKQNVCYYGVTSKNLAPDGCIEWGKPLQEMQTSAQGALYLALYLGAKEIYLLGCDHDWILNLGQTRHFYDESKSALSRRGYNEWDGKKDFGEEFESYVNLWRVYKRIRAYAEMHGVHIWNATKGGLLDVFPRKNLDEIVGR